MAIRLYRAYSPGTRSKSVSYFDDLSNIKPEKALTFGKKACGGRNNRGVITVKGRGGSHKRRYRIIDFVLSNFVNSGFYQIKVLTQYKASSLISHITRGWQLAPILGHYVEPVPAQMRVGRDWFKGSADAVFQNLNLISRERTTP